MVLITIIPRTKAVWNSFIVCAMSICFIPAPGSFLTNRVAPISLTASVQGCAYHQINMLAPIMVVFGFHFFFTVRIGGGGRGASSIHLNMTSVSLMEPTIIILKQQPVFLFISFLIM